MTGVPQPALASHLQQTTAATKQYSSNNFLRDTGSSGTQRSYGYLGCNHGMYHLVSVSEPEGLTTTRRIQGVPALFRWLSKKYPKISMCTYSIVYLFLTM